jgi:ubiquinone/menaquinone biosynthesis C-methylase UbiE
MLLYIYLIKKYFKQCDVTGIDIDSSFVKYAKLNFKNCNYIQDNLFETKLKDSSFNFIVLNCSMHFFYDQNVPLQNIYKKLKNNGKLLVTDLWTKEAFVIFLNKCSKNKLKIISIEDQTDNTIKSMEEDISKTFIKFKNRVDDNSIDAFIKIQKDRLEAFKKNINRHYKFVIQKI